MGTEQTPVENLGQNLGHEFLVRLNFKKLKLPPGVRLRHLLFPYH